MDGPHARVLVLGGGDGLAAREVLRHPGVRRVDVVELDAGVVRLARRDPALSALNAHAFDDPRVHVTTADAFRLLRGARAAYDVVVSDLPDPGITASTKLYSQEFYGLARAGADRRRPAGRARAGRSSARPRAFWTVETTIRAAGLRTVPYRVAGPGPYGSAGRDAGPAGLGVRAGDGRGPAPRLRVDGPAAPRLRTLTQAGLAADARAAERMRVVGLRASTLVHPRY